MINPFKPVNAVESPEMKALFKELRELNARICLLCAEEKGVHLDMVHIHRAIIASTDFDIAMFKSYAQMQLNELIGTSTLHIDELVAIAAHEAYKKVKEI